MQTPSRPRRLLRRAAQAFGAAIAGYGLFLLVGFVPVNLDYQPPQGEAVTIYVRSNEIHTDVVLPVRCDDPPADWSWRFPPEHFATDVSDYRYVAVGWGNRQFYVETPTWADFKLSSAVAALFWPSETVLHVEYLYDVAEGDSFRRVLISREQYRELVGFIESSADRFYQATGRYHAFNTCNQWTGRGLARAGAPVGIWTPLKPQVLWRLPASGGGR
jgi:hypothetical protein